MAEQLPSEEQRRDLQMPPAAADTVITRPPRFDGTGPAADHRSADEDSSIDASADSAGNGEGPVGPNSQPVNEEGRPKPSQEHDPRQGTTSQWPRDQIGAADRADSHHADGPLFDQKTVISKSPFEAASKPPRFIRPAELGATLEGQMLGHFRLGAFVGGGGMGAVFRAVDTMLERTVAVKVLSRDEGDSDILRRFKNEAQSAARLDHPNIARVYYVGEDQGWNYIVFEFIEGANIRDLASAEGPLPLDQAIKYTWQIADALEHAHSRNVVHRDIKPSNVLITPQGQAKLVDMGLARLHHLETTHDDLTASGVTLGTFDYISPEQAKDSRDADVRSDIYSLGCTFYFMLTGRPPFPEGTVVQKLLSHAQTRPPSVIDLRPDLPDELGDIIEKMMAKAPEDRYQLPSELIGELLVLAESLGLSEATKGGAVWLSAESSVPSTAARIGPWVVTAASFLLVVGAALAVDSWLSSRTDLMHGFGEIVLQPALQLEEDANSGRDAGDDSSDSNPQGVGDSTEAASSKTGVERAKPGFGLVAPLGMEDLFGPSSGASALAAPTTAVGIGPLATNMPAPDHAGLAAGLSVGEQGGPETGSAEIVPSVLIVGDPTGEMFPHQQAVATLEEALRMAALSPDIESIEIWADRLELRSFRALFSARYANDDGKPRHAPLVIRGGPDYEPVLVFRPDEEDAAVARGALIELEQADHVTWDGLHFVVDLPKEQLADWSVFTLRSSPNLTFTRCTFTVINEAGHLRTSVFRMAPPAGEAGGAAQSLQLNECVVRGGAVLILADPAGSLQLTWTEGLFIGPSRLVEARGQAGRHRSDVVVQLSHVTVNAPSGLCLMEAGSAAEPPFLALDCRSCIVLSDANAFLAWCAGARDKDMPAMALDFDQTDSYFPSAEILARIEEQGEFSEIRDFTVEDSTDLDMGSRPKRVVSITPPADRPLHEHTPDDYALSDTPTNMPARGAGVGFHLEELPIPPRLSFEPPP